MATIFALDTPEIGPDPAKFALPVAISAIPAVLMVTTIRFRSFRHLLQPRTRHARLVSLGVLAAVLIGLVVAPGLTGLAQVEGALTRLNIKTPDLEDEELPRQVVEIVYQDVDESLWGAAEWSVRAQLAYLAAR